MFDIAIAIIIDDDSLSICEKKIKFWGVNGEIVHICNS